MATPIHAQSVLPEHLHVPVEVDPGLSWEDLLTATVESHPRRFELSALAETASAWQGRGRQWLAGAPYASLSYLSDRMGDDRGQAEYSAGVTLPLWRWGQRGTAQRLGSSATAASTAAGAALRWELAGVLRGMLWDIAAAGNDVALAQESLSVADDLLRGVERQHALGDLAAADVLLARTARYEKSLALIESEASLLDAERSYRSLTGLDRRPAVFVESLATHSGVEEAGVVHGPSFDNGHPLLALADAEVARAQAALDFATHNAFGNPTLTIGPRRQRDALTDFYNDSMNLSLSLPFGGRRYGSTSRAEAASVLAAAEMHRAQLLRQLDLELHEAEHTLYVVEQSLAVAKARDEDAARQWAMGRAAFAQGEIELRELLRIQDTAQIAARDLARLEIDRQRAIAAMNQALGVLP